VNIMLSEEQYPLAKVHLEANRQCTDKILGLRSDLKNASLEKHKGIREDLKYWEDKKEKVVERIIEDYSMTPKELKRAVAEYGNMQQREQDRVVKPLASSPIFAEGYDGGETRGLAPAGVNEESGPWKGVPPEVAESIGFFGMYGITKTTEKENAGPVEENGQDYGDMYKNDPPSGPHDGPEKGRSR
jgi:hypothetical protein